MDPLSASGPSARRSRELTGKYVDPVAWTAQTLIDGLHHSHTSSQEDEFSRDKLFILKHGFQTFFEFVLSLMCSFTI